MVVPPQSTQVRRWTANRVKKTSVLDRIMISGWLKQILIQSLNYGPDSQAIFWDLEHICCTWGAPVGKFFGFSLGTSRFALCTVEPTVYIHAVCTQDLSRIRIFLRFVYKEAENERKVFVNQHTHTNIYVCCMCSRGTSYAVVETLFLTKPSKFMCTVYGSAQRVKRNQWKCLLMFANAFVYIFYSFKYCHHCLAQEN